MLPLLYPDADTREALLADPSTAPIPALHRAVFRFTEKFVTSSWTSTPADLERLREEGLSDREIVHWATLGSTQTWFTMSADGGGIPLEGDAFTGPGVGRTRDSYEATGEGLLAADTGDVATESRASDTRGIAWVDTDETSEAFANLASWAKARYGFVPNLLRAVSILPGFEQRNQLALELLEAPQSENLSPRHHAMVRVLVSHLNRSSYGHPTAVALLGRVSPSQGDLAERVCAEPLGDDWSPLDRAVLNLASKLARNAYKVTEKDAIALREAGLDDEAYVDILNTVSIQTSLDRLTNVLGVRNDPAPVLAKSN